ncbi:hypothetical protein AF331_11410 [Rossellomorea marisflavi]|uniref:Uncharacterized protein n=2 Tax=Rossellomorea marisflavi TaxID=189381 RepID=A0A0M0G512_9BACI|nr:hypothetical protein [Rossellomorea marisflavi]KON84637.1 hypothetical protein AF331_11410 [Rossellomorea marisflavi]MDR4937990.1 hypothetical protein [Rossellomorea marisflavi]
MKLVMDFVENQRVGNKFFKVGRKNPIDGKKIQKAGNKAIRVIQKKTIFNEIKGNGLPPPTPL